MGIDLGHNALDITGTGSIYLADDGTKIDHRTAKRVGIDYATPDYRDIKWRYIAIDKKNNLFK